jgi:hypothetical protein
MRIAPTAPISLVPRSAFAPRAVEKVRSSFDLYGEQHRETASSRGKDTIPAEAKASHSGTYARSLETPKALSCTFAAQIIGQVLETNNQNPRAAIRSYAVAARGFNQQALLTIL